jgi:hypothetical protein
MIPPFSMNTSKPRPHPEDQASLVKPKPVSGMGVQECQLVLGVVVLMHDAHALAEGSNLNEARSKVHHPCVSPDKGQNAGNLRPYWVSTDSSCGVLVTPHPEKG